MTERTQRERDQAAVLHTGTMAPATRSRDLVWEVCYLAQTWQPYEPGAPMTAGERAKVNAAAKQIRDAGFTVDDVRRAMMGWPAAMGNCAITANGLAANLRRCLNAAAGASGRRELSEVDRIVAEIERRKR